MTLDNQVFDIEISLGAPSVTRQGFGIPIIIASAANLNPGFTERVRSYSSAEEAEDDGDLKQAIKDRVAAIFAQNRSPNLVKVGRREADVAQQTDFTVTGSSDGDYTITINNLDHTFTAVSNTVADIVAGLVSEINTGVSVTPFQVSFNDNDPDLDTIVREDGGSWLDDGVTPGTQITFTGTTDNDVTVTAFEVTASTVTVEFSDSLTDEASVTPASIVYNEQVTAVDASPVVEVTADVAGQPFDFSTSSTGDPITASTTTANVGVFSELSDINDADSDWFHFVLDTRSDADIVEAARWAQTFKRMFWSQSSSADIITTATTDVFSELKAKSFRWTASNYYSDDAVLFDVSWAGFFAANDFDQEAPTALFNTLVGIEPDSTLTSTIETNLNAKNVNYYTTLKGVGATANATTPAGFDIELVVTGAWTEARTSENTAQLFLARSNSGQRVRFNNDGFQQIRGVFLAVLKDGERIGHFNTETSEVEVPDRSEVPQVDVDTGTLRLTFGTQYSGRVNRVVVRGTVSADFETLAAA